MSGRENSDLPNNRGPLASAYATIIVETSAKYSAYATIIVETSAKDSADVYNNCRDKGWCCITTSKPF